MRAIIAAAISLALGGSAVAAGHERADQAECKTVDALKASLKDTKLVTLSPGRFHFVEGLFAGLPPIGLPNADGALLASGKGSDAVVWMRGKCVATDVQIFPLPKPFVAMLRAINPGVGETIDANDSDKDMKL